MPQPTVTIYTTPTCAYCRMAKQYFAEHKIEYTEKNVAVDPEARKAMIEKSNQMGVPVIDIGGKIIVGFDEDKITQALHAL